jgi:hypothetical protein
MTLSSRWCMSRGGSWFSPARGARAACRDDFVFSCRFDGLSLRLCRRVMLFLGERYIVVRGGSAWGPCLYANPRNRRSAGQASDTLFMSLRMRRRLS